MYSRCIEIHTCKLAARCFPIAEMGRKNPATEGASSLEVFSLNWIVIPSVVVSVAPGGAPVTVAFMPFAGMNRLAPCQVNPRREIQWATKIFISAIHPLITNARENLTCWVIMAFDDLKLDEFGTMVLEEVGEQTNEPPLPLPVCNSNYLIYLIYLIS